MFGTQIVLVLTKKSIDEKVVQRIYCSWSLDPYNISHPRRTLEERKKYAAY